MASSGFRLLEANPYFLELSDVVLTIAGLGYYKQRITHVVPFSISFPDSNTAFIEFLNVSLLGIFTINNERNWAFSSLQ